MTNVSVKGTINASADDVWKTVSSFRDIEKYLPVVKSSVTEGSGLGAKRTCTVATPDGKEAKIDEEVTDFDENAKSLTYKIAGFSPFPFENYKATVIVTDAGNNTCEIEWSCTFDAKGPEAEVTKMMNDVYVAGIDGLKKLHSG
jgi:carbon monoxide dehydrogenase subunit G